MTPHRPGWQPQPQPQPPLLSRNAAHVTAASLVLCAACATAAPEYIPDTTERIAAPSATAPSNPEDVFLRKPWEIWRSPKHRFRFHKEAGVLLPDEDDAFRLNNVSVYAPDGSDVRVDYESVNLDPESQAQESISVFVYRAPTNLDQEWQSVLSRLQHEHPGAQPAEPFPAPAHHPAEIRQTALLVPSASDPPTFHQTTLFHQGAWAIRYEIKCLSPDIPLARKKTAPFLTSLRPD